MNPGGDSVEELLTEHTNAALCWRGLTDQRGDTFGVDRLQCLCKCCTVGGKRIVPNRRIPEFIDDLQQPSAFVIVVYLDVDFCSVMGDALTQGRINQRIFSIGRIVFLHDTPRIQRMVSHRAFSRCRENGGLKDVSPGGCQNWLFVVLVKNTLKGTSSAENRVGLSTSSH